MSRLVPDHLSVSQPDPIHISLPASVFEAGISFTVRLLPYLMFTQDLGRYLIVNALIRRIDVYRGYRVHIDFNIDFDQFRYGLDLRGKTISFEDISA